MKEIQFRAWDEVNHRLIQIYGESKDIGDYNFVNPCSEQVKIMQYTGLKDKNDKKMYEGDIVCLRKDREHGVYTIRFGVGIYDGGYYKFMGFYLDPQDTEEHTCMFETKDIEIIGNLYENPELLK